MIKRAFEILEEQSRSYLKDNPEVLMDLLNKITNPSVIRLFFKDVPEDRSMRKKDKIFVIIITLFL
jgi:hypothetical protein